MNILFERESIENIDNEKQLIILLSRLTFSKEVIDKARKIISDKNFNWFKFYSYALYHKVVTLCWKNVKMLFPDIFQPKYVDEMVKATYLSIAKKNQLYENEINDIIKCLDRENIKIVPVKGAYLIPEVYKDYGIRYSGDADFLIRFDDLSRAEKILQIRGYIKGKFDQEKGCIIPISRSEDIKWKTFMSNNHPLLKLCDSEVFSVYKIDFRYALDDSLIKESVNEIIVQYINTGVVNVAHYLIHLCTHFYDEAKHTADIVLAKDVNIIKLCDIREYVIQCATKKDLHELVNFAKKYRLESQVYFTMVYLYVVYNDGYEESIIKELNVEDDSILYTLGDNTMGNQQKIELGILERLFACGEINKLIKTPKLFL